MRERAIKANDDDAVLEDREKSSSPTRNEVRAKDFELVGDMVASCSCVDGGTPHQVGDDGGVDGAGRRGAALERVNKTE